MLDRVNWIHIYRSGRVQVVGIDQGDETLVALTNDYVVLKVKGKNYWAGIGIQKYGGTEYQVYERVEESRIVQGVLVIRGKHLVDVPIRLTERQEHHISKRIEWEFNKIEENENV